MTFKEKDEEEEITQTGNSSGKTSDWRMTVFYNEQNKWHN